MTGRLFPLIAPLWCLDRNTSRLIQLGDNLTHPQRRILDTVETVMVGGGEVRVVGGTRDFPRPAPIRLIILKARQMGVSTLVEAITFATSMVRPHSRSLIVSHDLDSSRHLLDMTRRYWETSWIAERGIYTPKNLSGNLLSWHEPDTAIRVTTAKNLAGGRSHTIHNLHASEVAFWEHAGELMDGLNQAIPRAPLTFQFLESTANGFGNYFKQTWDAAVAGDNSYLPIFEPWWRHGMYTADHIGIGHLADRPLTNLSDEERRLARAFTRIGLDDRDVRSKLLWRREILNTECKGDIDIFHQEYPACLMPGTRVSTGRGVIPVEQVQPGDVHPNGPVDAVTTQSPARCVRVTTRNGRQIDCTWHHPLVDETGVLIPAASTLGRTLQPSRPTLPDTLHTFRWSRHGVVDLSVEMTERLALFLGYYMGDGSFSNSTLSIACDRQDRDVIDEIADLFGLFGLTANERVVGPKRGGVELRAGAKALRGVFDDLGWVPHRESDQAVVRNVHVPDTIWCSPLPVVKAFLSGLFEADGYSNKVQWDVRLFTRYERFARDVALLIDACGGNARACKSQTGWTVGLTSSDAEWFHEHIGFRSERKRRSRPSHRPQRPRVNPWEVVSVDEIGEHVTYDLTINQRPYFDANGFLSHNTPEEAFVSTGRNVFNPKHLMAAYEPMDGERGQLFEKGGRVEFVPDRDGDLTIFRHPRPSGWYMVGADAAKQAKGDFAAAEVQDRITWEQVAEFRADIDPNTFADQIMLLGRYYNDAMLIPETNMSGHSVVAEIVRSRYPNVYVHQSDHKVRGQMAGEYGFNTNERTKPEAVGHVKRALLEKFNGAKGMTIHSRVLYKEMAGYIFTDTGRYQNSSSEEEADHDDTTMAWCLATTGTIHRADDPDRPYPSRVPHRREDDDPHVRQVAATLDATTSAKVRVETDPPEPDADPDDPTPPSRRYLMPVGTPAAYDDYDEPLIDEGDPW